MASPFSNCLRAINSFRKSNQHAFRHSTNLLNTHLQKFQNGSPIILNTPLPLQKRNFSTSNTSSAENINEEPPQAPRSKRRFLKVFGLLLPVATVGGFIWFIRPSVGGAGVKVPEENRKSGYIDFQDFQLMFSNKSTSELYFALFIFGLCNTDFVVNMAPGVVEFAKRWGLNRPFYWLMKKTFYKHFCGGETLDEVLPIVKRYKENGINVILDYSTEDALEKTAWEQQTVRVVDMVNMTPQLEGKFVPLKITGLCHPRLLERMTEWLRYEEKSPNSVSWNTLGTKVLPLSQNDMAQPTPFTPEETQELKDVLGRLSQICEAASRNKVSLLFDAEQTHRQLAIDYLALEMSRKYNKERPIVYNTYQAYLRETWRKVNHHAEWAKKANFYLGVKLVRGAYLITETERAVQMKYKNPIWKDKDDTDANYQRCYQWALEKISQKEKLGIVIASHNMYDMYRSCQKIRELKLASSHPNINFAQLNGMAEHLTFGLSLAFFNANKLIPYGPIENIVPYLVRRLQENRSLFGGTQIERQLMWSELKRRKFGLIPTKKTEVPKPWQ